MWFIETYIGNCTCINEGLYNVEWGAGRSAKMVCKWSICTFHIKLVHTKTMPVRCRQTRWQSNMDRGCKEAEHLHSVNIYRVPWKPYTYYITICPQSEQAHIAKPNSKDTTCRSYFKPLNTPHPLPAPQTSTTSALSSHMSISS